MTNMPNHPQTHGPEPTERRVLDAPWSGTGSQPQLGQQRKKTRPTPTPRRPISHTRPKTSGPPKCKLPASIGTRPHKQTKRNCQHQPWSRADPVTHCLAHHQLFPYHYPRGAPCPPNRTARHPKRITVCSNSTFSQLLDHIVSDFCPCVVATLLSMSRLDKT
ncbi:hypothetical protein ILYODFUR_037406 [Ilyodon furcidens]|uniref:Uncharacterized protein n=1 Tax=Ilyodon furcidens TaxID=33524 RepID=A0ABV0TFJ5_9TELE